MAVLTEPLKQLLDAFGEEERCTSGATGHAAPPLTAEPFPTEGTPLTSEPPLAGEPPLTSEPPGPGEGADPVAI